MLPALALTALAQPPDTSDAHRWLEDVDSEAALDQVRTWNAATDAALAGDPRLAELTAEALEILTSDARIPDVRLRGDHLYDHWQDRDHVRGLWRRTPLEAFLRGTPAWEVLIDVDALARDEDANWIWHGASCAPRSTRCLIDLSPGGTDASVRREFDLSTRAFVDDGFVVPLAKSSTAWIDADTLLVSTDAGEGSLTESGYPRHIAVWARGTALADAPIVFSAETADVSSEPWVLRHGGEQLTLVGRSPSFFELELSVLGDDGLEPLPMPRSARPAGLFRGELLLRLREGWSHGAVTHPAGALVALDLAEMSTRAVWTPSPGRSLQHVAIGRKALTLVVLEDVVGRLVRVRPRGDRWISTPIALPDQGQVSVVTSDEDRDDLLASFESLTVPDTLVHVDKKDTPHAVMSLPAFFDPAGVVVEQRFATSADGTRVPYFLMGRQDVLDAGPAPTIQYGYGGFLASILPTYFSSNARPQHGAFAGRMWVAKGGVLVLSNIRGGAEYGPEWHRAALKHHRQRAFDDFFAIGEHLVETSVTTPDRLGAIGRSNGGLLMGVAFTQRPDLYAAIDCGVPLLDMLRYDRLLAGASWVGEFGDPDIPEDRAVLAAYSPYHNLADGVDYPAILFYTSTRDDRVHPGHARKMAAKLEAMGVPFTWFENIEGGHGGVANQAQAAHRLALEFLFFHRELGLAE